MLFWEQIKPYWDIILTERSWSWTLIAIGYLAIALNIRALFLHPIKRKLKDLDKTFQSKIKRQYLKHSILGWMLFFIPLILSIIYWAENESFWGLPKSDALFGLTICACFIFSVISHLQAFAIASMLTLKKYHTKQEELKL